MSHLRLVKSCNESFSASKHDIVMDLTKDKHWKSLTNILPPLNELDRDFYDLILGHHVSLCRNRIHFLMEESDIDYTLEIQGVSARLRVNSEKDSKIAAAHLFPTNMIDFEFLKFPEYVSDAVLEHATKALQQSYDFVVQKKSKLHASVTLRADFETHAIHATTLGSDMLRVMEHGKHFGELMSAQP